MFDAILRDIIEVDLPKILTWRNQSHIREVMLQQEEILWENHRSWYHSLAENPTKLSKVFTVSNIDYGILNISEWSKVNNCCSWGFYIGDREAPKGTGLLMGFTSLNYIFIELGMRKVCAEVIETNVVSHRFHVKLGFRLDGILRKQIRCQDKYEDLYIYSLFANEWIKKRKQIEEELKRRYL